MLSGSSAGLIDRITATAASPCSSTRYPELVQAQAVLAGGRAAVAQRALDESATEGLRGVAHWNAPPPHSAAICLTHSGCRLLCAVNPGVAVDRRRFGTAETVHRGLSSGVSVRGAREARVETSSKPHFPASPHVSPGYDSDTTSPVKEAA